MQPQLLGDRFFLDNRAPARLPAYLVSPSDGRWGRNIHLQRHISDLNWTNATCTLYVSTDGGWGDLDSSGETYANSISSVCNAPMSIMDFTSLNMGSNTTSSSDKRHIQLIQHICAAGAIHRKGQHNRLSPRGERTSVLRFGSNFTELKVRLYDSDKENISGRDLVVAPGSQPEMAWISALQAQTSQTSSGQLHGIFSTGFRAICGR